MNGLQEEKQLANIYELCAKMAGPQNSFLIKRDKSNDLHE